MESLIYIKETFCKNATSFPQISDKTRFWLMAILILNIMYVIANGRHAFANQHYISVRTLNTVVFAISSAAFIFVLRNNLKNTLNFKKEQLKRSIVYASITYFLGHYIYWIYNVVMTILQPPLGGDVQGIRQMEKMDWYTYLTLFSKYIFTLINEELLIFAVMLIVMSFFKPSVKVTLFSIFCALVFFGMLHGAAWNLAAIPAVMVNKLPACLLLVMFMDLKPLYFSHLFNNLFVSSAIVAGVTSNMRSWAIILFALPLVLWLCSHTISDIKAKETA